MSKTVYFGMCSFNDNVRSYSLASNTLMEYVTDVLHNTCDNFLVVSYAPKKTDVKQKAEEVTLENGKRVLYLPQALNNDKSKIKRFFTRLKNESALKKGLLNVLNDGDTLVVYHSLGIMKHISEIRRKRKIKLILEVCEIYSDVRGDKKEREKELDFIKSADGYIFSSSTLNRLLNKENKPFAICMGAYKNAPIYDKVPSEDKKCHIVYAGTFNLIKGGVVNAIEAAKYLDEGYHLHLLGLAEGELFKVVVKKMLETLAETGCEITYDGCLQGEEYLKFLQKCDIGLSTQTGTSAFNETSFPSKILVYLANGLKVVSCNISPVKSSELSNDLFFYEGTDPESIARAIQEANKAEKTDTRATVSKLDKEFCEQILDLLRKTND